MIQYECFDYDLQTLKEPVAMVCPICDEAGLVHSLYAAEVDQWPNTETYPICYECSQAITQVPVETVPEPWWLRAVRWLAA